MIFIFLKSISKQITKKETNKEETKMVDYTLLSFDDLKTENIIFSDPFQGTHRTIIPLAIQEDGEDKPLIINTPSNLLSFGIQEIQDKDKKQVLGYQMPICLWGKKKVSEEEKSFTDKFEELIEYIKNFLRTIKEEVNITDEMINQMNILNWKYENGKRKEDKGPLLYSKLIMNNRTNKIITSFFNEEDNTRLEPFDLMNQKCVVTAALKIENIIIGKKISVQVKLFEVLCKKIQTFERKPIVHRSLLKPEIIISKTKGYREKDTITKNETPKTTTNNNIFRHLDINED